jgi:LysR family hydrogen peroxide-inducible transcriptional activator
MTLQQLEYIVALDTHRHFVTAAEHCFVTQPTLTLQIKKLENEMGTIIFDRTKQPIAPTQAGELIISKAREILREAHQLKDLVNEEKDSISGTFRVGVIPTVAPYLIPLFLNDFVNENPKTKLVIREIESAQIIQELNNDNIDIGLMATPLDEPRLKEIPLYNEPFLLYTSMHHPYYLKESIELSEISEKGLLLLTEGHCLRNQVLNICEKRNAKTNHFSYESGSIETLKNLVKHNMGYTLVPELSVLDELFDKRVKRFNAPEPVREISLVVHKSFNKELILQKLRESLLKNIPEHFHKAKKFNRIQWR